MIRLRKQGLSETSSTCSGIRTLLDGSGGAPLVSVMQPAQLRYRDDPARLRRLDRSGLRSILLQCQVNAVPMINSPRMSGGGGTGFVRGTRLGDPGTRGEASQ